MILKTGRRIILVSLLLIIFCSDALAIQPELNPSKDFCNLPKLSNDELSRESSEFLHVARQKGQASVWESQSSGLVYIIDQDNQTLTILDKNKNFIEEQQISIPVGKGAIGVIANKSDTTAFVTNKEEGTLSVIDVQARKLSATILLKSGARPYCQIFGKDEGYLYIVTWASESVYVVDPENGDVVNVIGVKDLSRENQLNYCYKSCHKDRRSIMLRSIENKPNIPDRTIEIPPMLLKHAGLRENYQLIFKHISNLK